MKNKIDIAACTDRWFVMPTGVMMVSVCENNPETDVVFHIIVDDNVSAEDQQDIKDIAASYVGKSVVFYKANEAMQKESFPKGIIRPDITKTAYYRLYLAELLPREIDKVLYMDGDVIVRHSLLPLWNTDFGENAVAAVTDSSSGCIEFYNRLHYPFELGYFNSGVLLVNLRYWREHQVLNDFVSYMENHADSINFWDQDVLNVVFRDKKVLIPLKYNLQHHFLWKRKTTYDYWKLEKEISDALADPCIVHFTCKEKPWRLYFADSHPFNSTWDKYQNMTKWKGVKYDYRTKSQRIRRYAGNILRKFGLLSPLQVNSKFIDIAPID